MCYRVTTLVRSVSVVPQTRRCDCLLQHVLRHVGCSQMGALRSDTNADGTRSAGTFQHLVATVHHLVFLDNREGMLC